MNLTRRNLMAKGATIIGATQCVKAGSAHSNSKTNPSMPLIISTWSFGEAANKEALKVNKKGGSLMDSIEKGININMINNNGQTALHVAAHENNPYAIKILLKSGANADILTYFWNPKGKTAYQLAEDYMFHPHEKPFALMAFHEYDKEMNLAE